MKVELIDKMGSDLSVVNAARVSYGEEHAEFTKQDENLIKYLAKHKHWTPFAHTSLKLRIKAPIFVARQLVKHQVGFVWNEISRRYVDKEPEFYMPEIWRARGGNSKQGSSQTETIENYGDITLNELVDGIYDYAVDVYNALLEAGVCPEQARMVLPLSMYTEWIWTGSLFGYARVCQLRCAEDTQKETRDVANMIQEICANEFPISWRYLYGT